MTIYLIEERETIDSIGFGGSFKSEAYLSKETAEKRLNQLNSEKDNYCGYYFCMSEVKVIDSAE